VRLRRKQHFSVSSIGKRFNRVVIASADGIFAELAQQLQQLGVKVVIASMTAKVSHKLLAVAPVVVLEASIPTLYLDPKKFQKLTNEYK
jgi:uncharacterized LabA/DUF88 family protein